jgi:hypothetical protein
MYRDFQSLLTVLRESHRVRVIFRKVGGYLCLMSLMLSLEAALSGRLPYARPWTSLAQSQNENSTDDENSATITLILNDFLQLVFKVLTISMRFEPSNAKFFLTEVGVVYAGERL